VESIIVIDWRYTENGFRVGEASIYTVVKQGRTATLIF